jgi:RecA-family ATPase
LPIPASPESNTTWPSPLFALDQRRSSSSVSSSRPTYQAKGLLIPDFADTQNQLCEYHKYADVRSGTKTRLKREYKFASEKPPRSKKPKPVKPRDEHSAPAPAPAPVAAPALSPELDALILEDIAQREAAETSPAVVLAHTHEKKAGDQSAPPGGDGSGEAHRRHSSSGTSPHGSTGAPRGDVRATYIYEHPDLPPPHHYLLVEKRVDAAGKRNFFQYHWAGGRWHKEIKGTYAERKIPYHLPELKAALAADPNTEVQIAEGEKDADTLGRLGFVATTNPGGAAQWTDDLTAWLRVLGVRRIVLHEDHDKAGRDRTAQLSMTLADFATVRVAHYLDTPEGEDVTWWLEHGHSKAELEARIAAAESATVVLPYINMANWDHEPIPEQQWSVDGRIPRRQTAIFSGEGGAGKSIIQLHLSVAAVLGRDWLGATPEQGPAVFIDCEDDQDVLHYRLAALAQHYDACFTELVRRGLHLISLVGQDQVLATVSRSGLVEPTALYRQLLQAAGDIKPAMMGIAATANVFAGNESDRSQVQQFVNMTTRLAMLANGALVLISHPSLTGIATGTGLSGSTQWHNAVRARFFLKTPKAEDGEPPAHDLREIEFKKNQYGAMPESIPLRWQSGMFLPIDGATFTRVEQDRGGVPRIAATLQCRTPAREQQQRRDVCAGRVRQGGQGASRRPQQRAA